MEILECKKIDTENHSNILFIRIEPGDISITLRNIIDALSDLSWISKFDKKYIRDSFTKRAAESVSYLSKKIIGNDNDEITKNSGEYVVSELAREALVSKLNYLDIPLAEIFKEQVAGNPGFDFYSCTKEKIIVFGEAKYNSKQNAYGIGMEQVNRFITEEQDISDLNDIDKFFEESSLEKASKGDKAYAVAFASKKTRSEIIISGIIKNKYYCNLASHREVIFLAVNI